MAPPPPPLADELVEELLLRIPPDDPASLLRAALVCKDWCRVASGAVFRRRLRDLHRGAPPILGFIQRRVGASKCFSRTSSSSFRPRTAGLRGWFVLDSRHGRVLLGASRSVPSLAIWDPITGEQLELPSSRLAFYWQNNWPFCVSAAVLCAAASGPNGGCDHLDCRRGPFIVVLLSTVPNVTVHVYSSEDGAWSEPIYAPMIHNVCISSCPCPLDQNVLAGNALYFTCQANNICSKILEYDLGAREINWINLPRDYPFWRCPLLFTTTEYGRLGVAIVENSRLRLWPREAGPDQRLGWEQGRVIEIGTMLPSCNDRFIAVVGFVPGLDVFLLRTYDETYSFDVKSERMRKVCNDRGIQNVVPYMSLCTPGTSLLAF
ncbi:unnamed protein product [Urochloa decumbens]|uniref:F-box protein AT5G49610-like beta-propeller domain-containing protein n=1 Tax=Urochloa decumbens TaxID=240449 RepID=A0ABC9GWQ2_9POAL